MAKRWDKPLSLYEAANVPELFRPYVPDMRINLFEIAWLSREQVAKFRSDFRVVADYFVQKRESGDYSPSREKLRHVQETLQLLSDMTGDHRFESAVNDSDVKGSVDTMCEVLDKLIARGEARGVEQERLANLRSLMQNMALDPCRAMEALNIPTELRADYEGKLRRS